MKKFTITAAIALLALLPVLTTCKHTPDPILKIGFISGLGGFHDRGFNQDILDGFDQGAADFGFIKGSRETLVIPDFTTNINYFPLR